jgi:hypothetical protein
MATPKKFWRWFRVLVAGFVQHPAERRHEALLLGRAVRIGHVEPNRLDGGIGGPGQRG